MKKSILMVCLGNICRSPTAHGIMEHLVAEAGLTDYLTIDSAGTGDWHIGRQPDSRTLEAALRRGYDLSNQRARQVQVEDFERFDYVVAMDKQNRKDLLDLAPAGSAEKVRLLLDYAGRADQDVPDPYYGEAEGFEEVLDLVEHACASLLQKLVDEHGYATRVKASATKASSGHATAVPEETVG